MLDFPLQEIASFIADPASAPVFDKYIKVSYDHFEMFTSQFGGL